MKKEELRELLENLEKGKSSVSEVMEELKSLPYEDLGFAKIDSHRPLRKNMPEAILAEGKTPDQIKQIVKETSKTDLVMLTRVEETIYEELKGDFENAEYFPSANMIIIGQPYEEEPDGHILVATGGTGDLPVAEEAAVTAKYLGNKVKKAYDIGVAGIHRLLDHEKEIHEASVIIAVAGMEGSLPSVIGGIASAPVIGVPTSKGYGTNFGGVSALLSMLNSCAPGIAVVNIDNGYGAGCIASLINRAGKS